MSAAPRPTDGKHLNRWLPLLERLEARETPAVTAALSQVATWTELGPNVITNGQVSNITSVNPNGGGNATNPVIGAVSALVAHPTDPNIMYAGTPNGGVWRTTNAQAASPTWTPLSDDLASLSVSDLSLDPANPNRLIVGIGGTADGAEVEPTGVVRGDLIGVLITDDATVAAPTWRLVGGPLANKNVTKVAVRGNIWVIGTDAGLFRSTDNGVTFTNIFSSTINNGVTYQDRQFDSKVFDLAQNTRLPNQMYIATNDFAGLGKQIWRTDDNGLTWGNVTDSQMQLSTNTTSVKISVRDNGEFDNQVYVSVVNTFPTGNQQILPGVGATFAFSSRADELSSVTWSTNQGGNWTRMDDPRRMTEAEGLDLGMRAPQGGTDPFQGGGLQADGTRILVVTDRGGPFSPFEDGWGHRLKTGDWVHIEGVTNFPPTTSGIPPQDTIFDLNNGNTNFFQVEVRDAYSFWLLGVTAPSQLMDSTGAFWQKVESATAGEAGFTDIVAAPASSLENLVYLGGDFNSYRFDAAGSPAGPGILGPFPSTFTGSIWQGNRFTVPINPNANPLARGTANQWANLVDVAGANGTAPGGDTRQMLFDSLGNLWVATGTGIYKRSITPGAAPANTPATSSWTNVSGNIRVSEFWGVGYDTHNNLAVGATQDTGIVEQNANGNLTYDAPLDRLSENFYNDQAYSYEVAVDNTSNANQVTRYYVGSAFGFSGLQGTQGGIVRRVFNNAGALIASNTLNLANALTTNAPLSGINAADIALGQDTSARVVMELNSNDRRRGAYGLTRVYEDSDPLGPGSTPVTGFVVSDVTPLGMTGRVRSMSYGGKRTVNGSPVNFNQVMFVGTTTGQLWVRGEFGTQFTDTMGGTTTGFPVIGSGPVTDIQLDPDDYRHAFVAKGGQVYETRDLGVTWTNLSAGLVSAPDPTTGLPSAGGLTTQIYTIALFDPNPGTANVGTTGDVVLLAGGRGGVFRRTISACGTDFVWAEYGNNLPNTVVMELDIQGSRLVAGTFGRGVWTVPDVTPTLTQTLFLDIIGDAAANTINLTSDPLDPNAVIVTDGLGLNARFSFGQFDQIRIFGQGGADTVTIASGLPANGNLQFVDYPISVNMGGDAGDTLIINDSSNPTGVQVTVDATTIGMAASDTIFDGCGSITYSGLQNGVLSLLTGAGNDSLFLANGVLPPTILLNGGAGDDTYFVNSLSTSNVFITDPSGNDTLSVTMAAGQTAFVDAANKTLVVAGLSVTTTGIDAFALDPTSPSASVVWTASNGSDGAFLTQDTLPGWSALSLNGFRTSFHNMGNVTVNMLAGNDAFQIDSNGALAGGTTQFVTYLVTVNMGGDVNDTLVIDSSGSTAPISATVNGVTVGANPGIDTLFGGIGYVNYTGLLNGGMLFRTGSGNDKLYFDAAATLNAVVYGGAGTDQVWTLGTAGNDNSVAYLNSLRTNAMNVVGTFGVEQYGVVGNGGADMLNSFGTVGTDALTISQLGVQSATIGGITVPTTYLGVQTITLDGLAGNDTLAWTDLSNTAYGTAINPFTGLVYAPLSATNGRLSLGGAPGSVLWFYNVGGSFTANGDPAGSSTRDVFSILAPSSSSSGSAFGELTTPNGSDTIAATDAGVTITNASVGALKGVTFGQTPGGFLGFSTVFVRGGNETGTGDTFTATTTTRTNLLLDGGNPTSPPGDSLTITTNGPAATTESSDPALGPPHTRVTSRADQSSVGYLNFEQVTAITPDPNNPGGPPIPSFGSSKSDLYAVGTDAGSTAEVKVYNLDGSQKFDLFPFGGFTGGVRVAVGDVTGDGKSDIVVAAGPGGGPIVKVYNGQTGLEVKAFYAYDPSFTGGVSVAVGNFNNDPFADIVTGAGAGGGPHVRLFDGLAGNEIYGFFAYDPSFTGGVNVAAADVTGDGLADIVTGTAIGAPHVKAFNGQTLAETFSFFAFDPSFQGGVNVAAGDVTNDGKADIIVGAGQGGATQVRVFDAANGSVIRDFVVNDPTIPGTPPINVTGGVRVAAADFDGDGLAEIVTGRGRGSRPFAQVLKVSTLIGTSAQPTLTSLQAINVFGDAYSNGIYVGA